MKTIALALAAFGLDAFIGDPAEFPHPVVLMGRVITFLEPLLRGIFPRTDAGEKAAGICLAALMTGGTWLGALGTLLLAGRIHPLLRTAIALMWGWQCLALRGLISEGENVFRKLQTGTLTDARSAVARIVGRDTENLTAQEVARAAVESVAENFTDGVFAPLCFLMLGGAPLALCYKAVNTMDSMIGYRNQRYLYFGRAAARVDDLANFLPSRTAALLIVAAAFMGGENPHRALEVWKRDRRKHDSPNSAQTEAAMAGALGICLGGMVFYGGAAHMHPVLGMPGREARAEDIPRACHLTVLASVLGLTALCVVRGGMIWLWTLR